MDNVGTGAELSNDGFTVAIKIKFAVQPCVTYHIKMAIADVGDGLYDSQWLYAFRVSAPRPN
ncbi:MAG: choice-of-anchor L domain-containing protein [Bacteroidetes bacterium]|nr:choice-of-anchor L domain-containing protein [Bacteroidota bacterium]